MLGARSTDGSEGTEDGRMADLEPSGFSQIDQLLQLVGRTRELLDAVVSEGELPAGGADYLADTTLPHLEGVEAGFQGTLRSEHAGLPELKYLLSLVGAMRVAPARSAAEHRAADEESRVEARAQAVLQRPVRPNLERAEPWNLAALAHARLVLAFLPRVPEWDVRFPVGRRTYADIPAPRGPAELAERILELERQLWRAATGRPAPPLDPGFRRTYGFFDAAERLGRRAFGLN
jgi:hypothetical protein